MNKIKKQKITKQIIYIIIVLMLCNFIMPNSTYATEATEQGVLFDPIAKFVTYLCDSFMEFLQNQFTTPNKLEVEEGIYKFQYSPAIIFSGEVPAFDINFIEPRKSDKKETDVEEFIASNEDSDKCIEAALPLIMQELGYSLDGQNSNPEIQDALKTIKNILYNENSWRPSENMPLWTELYTDISIKGDLYTLCGNIDMDTTRWVWYFVQQPVEDYAEIIQFKEGCRVDTNSLYDLGEYDLQAVDICYYQIEAYIMRRYGVFPEGYNNAKENIKEELQKGIEEAKKEVENSNYTFSKQINLQNGEKKITIYTTFNIMSGKYAIYKHTLKEYKSTAEILQLVVATWYRALRRIALVGLLSVLVYVGIKILLTSAAGEENSKYKKMLGDWLVAIILLFTMHYIMNFIIVVVNKISGLFNTGELDDLLGTIRLEIAGAMSWGEATSFVVMYVVLTIFTVTYTFQYLKKVLYMAFFTMIAPLVTLTYPLDKIKDGKAQAFSMWLKEYMFNALIQVAHLVVYYTLVGSAPSLVKVFPLYGVVAIAFMMTGEKIIRKMFGFNNADTIGAVGAAAVGGLVSKAMNSLKSLSSKASTPGNIPTSGGTSNGVRTASKNPLDGVKGNKGNGGAAKDGTGKSGKLAQNGGGTSTTKVAQAKKALTLGAKGAWGVATKYTGPSLKKLAGGLAGGAGALIGLASGLAQGDLGAAASGLIAGAGAGNALGKGLLNKGISLGGNVRNSVNNIKDSWNQGAYGDEYAQNAKFDREFRNSSAYKSLKQKYGDDFSDDSIQAMLDAGITDKGAMDKILENMKEDKYSDIGEAIGYSNLAQNCPESIFYDDAKLQTYLNDIVKNNNLKANANEIMENMKNFR